MRVVNHLDDNTWRRFIEEHPDSNVFHTPEIFQAFSQAKNHQPSLWSVVDESGRVRVLFPPVGVVISRWMPRLSARAVAYGGILCESGAAGMEALGLLLKVYRKRVGRSLLFTELRHLSRPLDIQPILDEYGFTYAEELNYILRLDRNREQILQGLGRKTRKHIRRGLRSGLVKISEVKEPEGLAEWYGLLKKTYARARVPLADRSLFDAVFSIMVPAGMAKFFVGKVEGKPAVCSLMIMHKDRIYDWYGGTDRRFGRFTPSELMIWHELAWGAENGYRVFDFGLAGSPDKEYGVRDFKAKFKGEEVCHGRHTLIHRPGALRAARSGYEALRAVKKILRIR